MTTNEDSAVAGGAEAAPAPAGTGNGFGLAALLCSVTALLLAGPIAAASWPFMIATVVLLVLARRRGAGRRWMCISAIILVVLAILVSLVMPTLILLVGFALLGEIAPADAFASYWHYWSGAYLFSS